MGNEDVATYGTQHLFRNQSTRRSGSLYSLTEAIKFWSDVENQKTEKKSVYPTLGTILKDHPLGDMFKDDKGYETIIDSSFFISAFCSNIYISPKQYDLVIMRDAVRECDRFLSSEKAMKWEESIASRRGLLSKTRRVGFYAGRDEKESIIHLIGESNKIIKCFSKERIAQLKKKDLGNTDMNTLAYIFDRARNSKVTNLLTNDESMIAAINSVKYAGAMREFNPDLIDVRSSNPEFNDKYAYVWLNRKV